MTAQRSEPIRDGVSCSPAGADRLRIVPTSLNTPLEWPPARTPGVAADILDAFLVPSGAEAARLKLENPDTLVVTTGQQPGLFTGPLYTVYKALSAQALATHLEKRWGRPVQAVFWVAGDDHDFAEANHVSWPSAEGTISGATLRPRDLEGPLTPMYREPLGSEIGSALDLLDLELPDTEFKTDVITWLRRHYTPEATVASSFAGALAELLAPHGVICFDSTHRAAKRAAARHIVRALGLARDLDRDLTGRAHELVKAGDDPGIAVGEGATLVMLEASAGRDRLVVDGDGFLTRRSAERFSLGDLQKIAATEPERLSGNVLLRPALESALLPTVAYAAGPGELRYLTLAAPVYERMRIHRQLPLPRWSGVLVEPRVDRVLEKFGGDLSELMTPGSGFEARIVRSQMPAEVMATLEQLREAITTGYDRLEPFAADIDPTLRKPVQSAKLHGLSESRDLEKRLLQHLKRRHETELAQVERARAAVLPMGKPQERVFGIVPYLARYGPGLLNQLASSIFSWYADGLEG
jgi:bacillithiol biosynthesis cysteine-adding enzyme BshC